MKSREKILEEETEKLEHVEELNPINAAILEKIKNLKSKIESIHRGALEQRDSKDADIPKTWPL